MEQTCTRRLPSGGQPRLKPRIDSVSKTNRTAARTTSRAGLALSAALSVMLLAACGGHGEEKGPEKAGAGRAAFTARQGAFLASGEANGRVRLTDGGGGIRQAEVLGVSLVDPDDARLTVDRDGALALRVQVIEQQRHGHRPEALGRHANDQAMLVEVVAGNGRGRVSRMKCR